MSSIIPPLPDQEIGSARRAPLEMEPESFRALGHDLVDRIADLIGSVASRPVTPASSVEAIRARVGAESALPLLGTEPAALLGQTAEMLFEHSLLNSHPRFYGYITSSPAPIGILGDLLASAVNPNVGAWTLSPIATEIEAQTIRWIAELVGYPTDAGGLLVSGGNMANFVGFLAARAKAAGPEIRRSGMAATANRRLRVYGSAETHTWIEKATDLFGVGTESFRWVATDDAQRMSVVALRDAIERDIAAGDLPMMVVATGGSVSTGAVDPLIEIAAICKEHGVWLHVDGAYGAFAALLPDAPPELHALALADSVALDPHKWLYAPMEAGCALVRDPEALRAAFSYKPPAYYHFATDVINYVDYGPQNSRGFRALKVWLALRQVGRDGYVRMLSDDCRLAGRLFEAAGSHAELEALTHQLSIATFRYVPAELTTRIGDPEIEEYLNRLNAMLLDHLQKSGEVFVSNAVIRGRYALRACIVNFRTSEADVDAVPEIVARWGRKVDAELRGGG